MQESGSILEKALLRFHQKNGGPGVLVLVQSMWPAALRLGGAFLQLLATILIARSLGAKDSGLYFFWAAAMMEIGQVATFGLDRYALQQVPRLACDPGKVSRFLAPLRVTALSLAVIGAIGLCGYALVFQSDLVRPSWWYLLPIFAVSGITLSMINSEAMTGMSRPVLAIFYRHTISVVTLLLLVVVAGDKLTTDLALVGYAGAFFLSGFGALLGPGMGKERRHFAVPSRDEFKNHLIKGSPIFMGSLFASLAFIVPLAVLERTHSSEQIAFLTTSFRLFVLIDVLARAIHSILMPELSLAAVEKGRERLRKIYQTATLRGIALLGFPILMIGIFARPVMEMFGDGFAEGTAMLQIFMGFGLVSLALGPAHQLLLMVGHTRRMAFLSFLHFLFTASMAFLLVPRFGSLGLALILGAGIAGEKILYLIYTRKVVGKTIEGEQSMERRDDE